MKSKLDEKRLKEIAESTGGFYLHLEDGPRTMKQLFAEGLAKMQAGDIDARLSRRPIERYQWPLGAALFFLAAAFLMRERRRLRPCGAPRCRSEENAGDGGDPSAAGERFVWRIARARGVSNRTSSTKRARNSRKR